MGKTLKEIYEAIPDTRKVVSMRGDFIARLMDVTKKSEPTVRAWISRGIIPDALTQDALAKELGVSVSDLFPKKNT